MVMCVRRQADVLGVGADASGENGFTERHRTSYPSE